MTLANQRFDRGLTDFLNVTDAERQLYELQDQYAIAQQDVVVQCIAIYKGLGGGWESYQQDRPCAGLCPPSPQPSARSLHQTIPRNDEGRPRQGIGISDHPAHTTEWPRH